MSINAQTLKNGFKKFPVLYICGLLGLVLLVCLYLRLEKIGAQESELESKKTEGERYQANVANSAQLKDQLNFLIEANAAVKKRTLRLGELAGNLQYFYRLEAETGVKLDVKPGSAGKVIKAGTPYIPLGFTVNAQGDFPQLMLLLRRLEQGTYFCRINTAVASAKGPTTSLALSLDLFAMP